MADASGGTRPAGDIENEVLQKIIRALPELTERVREEHHRLQQEEAERKKKEIDIGWIGRLVGDTDHAPTRIASIALIIGAVIVIPVALMASLQNVESPILDKIITGALSLMSAALGFVFGRSSGDRSNENARKMRRTK